MHNYFEHQQTAEEVLGAIGILAAAKPTTAYQIISAGSNLHRKQLLNSTSLGTSVANERKK